MWLGRKERVVFVRTKMVARAKQRMRQTRAALSHFQSNSHHNSRPLSNRHVLLDSFDIDKHPIDTTLYLLGL